MNEMEQPKTNPKEGEPEAVKIESADIKVDFFTAGEKLRNEEEKKLSEERLESFKLSAENDKTSNDALKESSDKIIRDLAEDYYNNNEDLIKQKTGFYEKNISREAKYDIVKKDEIGAFNDLKNKKGYWSEEHFDKFAIANGYDEIRAQLNSGKMRIESPIVLLNALERRIKEIINELKATDKNGALLLVRDGADRMNAEKKYNQIFSAQVELAEKIYGKTFNENDKKAISRFGLDRLEVAADWKNLVIEKKEEARKEIKERIFGKEWSGLDEKAKGEYGNDFNLFANSKIEKQIQIIGDDAKKYGIDQKTVLGLTDSGYNLENFKTTGLFRKKFHIASFGKGLSKEEFKQFIKSSQEVFENEISEQGTQKALKEQGNAIIIFKELKEKISKLAKNPDEAEGGIVKFFADIKERIIAEGIKNSVMKEGKSKEQLEKIAKEFGGNEGGEKELKLQFLDAIINRERGLENLTGDFDEDIENITGFMNSYGIPTDFVDQLASGEESGNKWAAGEMGKIRKGYKDNVKKKKGFISWTIDLMSTMVNPPKEPKKIIKNKQ